MQPEPTNEILDTSEYELLVALARTALTPAREAQAAALLERPLRWGYLRALARYHGVTPLVYSHLKRHFEEAVPEDALGDLHDQVHAQMASSLFLMSEMGTLGRLFKEEAIPAISVKGISLAQEVYGNLALRPFVDIDLLIRRSDFGRLEELLLGRGFQQIEMKGWQKSLYLFVNRQYTFWRPAIEGKGRLYSVLDVHTDLLPPGYSYGEGFDDLMARSVPMPAAQGGIHTLRPEDLLIVLCFHGFKNRWDRLKHVADVAEAVRAYPDLDWGEVFARAHAMRGRRVILLGLYLAHHVLGADLPAPIRSELEDATYERLGRPLIDRLPQQAHLTVEPYWDRVALNIGAQDGLAGRARYGLFVLGRRAVEVLLPESA